MFFLTNTLQSSHSYCLQDNSGTIEGDELTGFLKDLLEHEGKVMKILTCLKESTVKCLMSKAYSYFNVGC